MADLGNVEYHIRFPLANAKSDIAAIEAEADAMAARVGARMGSVGFGGAGGGMGAPSGAVTGTGQPAAGAAAGGGGGGVGVGGMAPGIPMPVHSQDFAAIATGQPWYSVEAQRLNRAAQQSFGGVTAFRGSDMDVLAGNFSPAADIIEGAKSSNFGDIASNFGGTAEWPSGMAGLGGKGTGKGTGLASRFFGGTALRQMATIYAMSRVAEGLGEAYEATRLGTFNDSSAHAYFGGDQARAYKNIPLLGLGYSMGEELGFIGSDITGTKTRFAYGAEASQKGLDDTLALERSNAMGMGGTMGRRRQIEVENEQFNREYLARQARRDSTVNDWGSQRLKEISLETQHNNFERKWDLSGIDAMTSVAGLNIMGMGRLGKLVTLNQEMGKQVDLAEQPGPARDPETANKLRNLWAVQSRATLMEGIQAGHGTSATGEFAASGMGAVRIGSPSGQPAEIVKLWQGIYNNTKKHPIPHLGW